MKKTLLLICISLIFSACVTNKRHVVGPGSSLSFISGKLAYNIKSTYDISGKSIQVSPNSFWEGHTRINLPFSTVLSDTLSTELSRLGAHITLQETGDAPLKLIGAYQKAKDDVIVTVKLRRMGNESSTDLAVAQERIAVSCMDPGWLEPQFSRLARTLVRLLEEDYSGMTALKINADEFTPARLSQPELALGPEFGKYMVDALSSSPVFSTSGIFPASANALLKGDYATMGSKMIFHAVVTDKNSGRHLATASFGTKITDIPQDLLHPGIQSIETLADRIATNITKAYESSPLFKQGPSLIYIGPKSFHDTSLGAVVPLSLNLAQIFMETFSKNPLFTVTDNPAMVPDFVLSGNAHKEDNGLVISTKLEKIIPSETGQIPKTIAFDQETLNSKYCHDTWFEIDLNGKTDYLMQRLENKSLVHIPAGKRPEIVINRFKYENSRQYSKFSDYLEGYMLDYFAASRYFAPVKNVDKRIAAVKTRGIRNIVATKKTGATVAALVNAKYYIDGSFWPTNNGNIEIKAALYSINGSVLASDHITVRQDKIDPSWLGTIQDNGFPAGINALSTDDSKLAVELLTQKGRNNLSFGKGEEITFLVKANKNVFLKLYTVDADHQIYRIYPNAFTPELTMIRAGELAFIPDNNYTSDFSFQVQGKTGNEVVFAFASNRPLPDLPGSSDTGFHGMHRVNLDIKNIKQWFSDYALQQGIFLSWDALPVRTY